MKIGKRPNMRRFLLVIVLSLPISSFSYADVRMPSVFGSNMVLQRDMKVPVWGWADPGEKILIKSNSGDKWKTKADSNGDWMVKIGPFEIGEKLNLTIKGSNTITLTNILIGDVWVCSGQSNMAMRVDQSFNGREEVGNANYPNIRLFSVEHKSSGQLLDDCEGFWEVCTPDSVDGFSAVGYFFGRHLRTELGVPIGLINDSWGGTRIEPWTPAAAFNFLPELKSTRNEIEKAGEDFKDNVANSLDQIQQWVDQSRTAIKTGKDISTLPKMPKHPLEHEDRPTSLFNAMINPIVPFGIRGAIWYQGEANRKDGLMYFAKMQALINGWRNAWDQGDFPFYIVQLSPYRYREDKGIHYLPLFWEAQKKVLSLKNTGMAVIVDISNINAGHPQNKQDVGKRLALWALAKEYGKKDLVYSGPLYKSMSVEGGKARISFDHVGSGLKSRDGEDLTWFSIAGADRKFVDAVARIDGDTVLVSSDRVSKPVAVRFGWSNLAEPNLGNREGLPASPFRTESW
jgi:sialate O-acetylesterase